MPTNTANARVAVAAINLYEKGYVDAVSNEVKELKWLQDSGCVKLGQGGLAKTWQAQTSTPTVRTYNGEANFPFTPTNTLIQPSLGYAGYAVDNRLSDVDVAIASGKEQLIDLIKKVTEDGKWGVMNALATDFHLAGTTTTYSDIPITGVQGFVINSGSYAGITYASEAGFFGSGNNILTGGVHASFSSDPLSSISQAVAAAEVGDQLGMATGKPDAIFLPFVNFAQASSAIFGQARGTFGDKKGKFGFGELEFEGIPLVKSRYVPAGQMVILNSKSLKMSCVFDELISFKKQGELSPDGMITLHRFYGVLQCYRPRMNCRVTIA